MKLRLLTIVVVLAAAAPTMLYAWEFLERDSCLDSGGAWFGVLGCRRELPKIDYILIKKSERRLIAFANGKAMETMTVSLGKQPVGHKQKEGDNRTPEGVYRIIEHKRDSAFYRALRLNYPTVAQSANATAQGINPGSDIMIHGLPNGLGQLGRLHRWADWTRGCVALTDGEIDWLYRATADQTLVQILP